MWKCKLKVIYSIDILLSSIQLSSQWPRSQVKTGGINIAKIEGVVYGEGLCPPQLGVWGLVPEKKIALKIMQF